jgi:hypothetical protein
MEWQDLASSSLVVSYLAYLSWHSYWSVSSALEAEESTSQNDNNPDPDGTGIGAAVGREL